LRFLTRFPVRDDDARFAPAARSAQEGKAMELTIRMVLRRLALTRTTRAISWILLVLTLVLLPVIALASDVFGDVPGTMPQHDAINRVYAAGIMRACTAGTPPNFCPNDPVLRAQQASQWDRALGLNGTPNAAVYVGRSRTTDISSAHRLPGPAISTLDSTGDASWFTSLAIGADGLGLISYHDNNTNDDLKVAHCTNTACSSASIATLDSAGDVGWFTSIAVGADGLGLISYYDNTNGDLKVAHCANAACSSASLATLDTTGDSGRHTSIAIGADGLGLISYYDATNGDLKVAHCANAACSSVSLATLDSAGVVGEHTSITIGADGLGLISYYDSSNGDLKVAHCTTTACSSAGLATTDSPGFVGWHTSIVVGVDGLALISYRDQTNGNLKVAHCANTACSSASLATLAIGPEIWHTSIAIGADGLGLISYWGDGHLNAAHCANVGCSSASLVTVDSAGVVGSYNSLTIGADGLALISYQDGGTFDLKVAHCANVACTPFYRSSR